MARTAKSICSDVCGARCCSWSFIELTPDEATRLQRIATEKHVPQPEIVAYDRDGKQGFVMHATPCTFLGKDNLCSIYKDRPETCRNFPDTLRDWCPLSRVVYMELLPYDRRPAPLDTTPSKRRRPQVRKRMNLAAATEPDA